MGNRYVIKRENFTPTAGSDVFTYVTASGRRARVIQVAVAGYGSTSAAQALTIARSTGGTTGGGAITPSKFEHTEQPAAAGTCNTTWAAQPTIESNGVQIGFNALSGAVWNAPAGGNKIEARNGENISLRAVPSGITFQLCSASMVIEED